MIYFCQGNTWKLSDFGISGRALTHGVTTEQSRGSPSYRAPELLNDTPKFTTKVDLWALGCILHECMTGKKTFAGDFAVPLRRDADPPQVHLGWSSQIWHDLVKNTVKHLLRCDPAHRPTAPDMVDLFDYYKTVLVNPVSSLVFNGTAGVSYEEFISICQRSSNKVEWLYEFAEHYKLKGEKSVATALFDEMTQLYLDTIQRPRDSNRATGTNTGIGRAQNVLSTAVFMKMLPYIPKWLLAWVCYELASYVISIDGENWEEAILICKHGLERDRDNAILPMLLSNLYAESGRYDDAMDTEARFYEGSDVNMFTMESSLFGFYARVLPAKQDYLNNIVTLLQS